MSATDVPDPGGDLQHLEAHLISQLERLGDKALETIKMASQNELGPNPTLYSDMEKCGRHVTSKLLEFADGKALLNRCIVIVQEKRVRTGVGPNLGQKGHDLVSWLRSRGKIRPAGAGG